MSVRAVIFSAIFGSLATTATADFAKVENQDDFIRYVVGKTLSHPLARLKVSPDGTISGNGSWRPVTGNWTWKDGYFCRDLFWGEDALGYNCQEVRINGGRMRFTSDRGQGLSAVFRIK